MIVEFSVFDTPYFSIEHLFDSDVNAHLIEGFEAGNGAFGLESYRLAVDSFVKKL